MSYTLGLAIILAEDDTGLTLRGQLVDNSGANVGSAFTTGFAEIGSGCYHLAISIPDGHRGGIVIMDDADASVLAHGSINPEQGENADAKTSTRGTADPGDAMDLVDAPNATAVAAVQAGLSTFDATADEVDVGAVKGTGVAGVADFRATGFSTHSAADVASLVGALVDALQSHGDSAWATAVVAGLSTLTEAQVQAIADALEAHGDSTWGPADVSLLALEATVANLNDLDGTEAQAAAAAALAAYDAATGTDVTTAASGLSTFDPATDEVDVGEVKGVAVAGVADFKADVSGLSTHSAADAATAVWAAGTRTLSGFGTLVADIATAVWGAAARTLTAFGFTAAANVTQIGGDAQSATDLKDFADTGYDPATHKVAGVVLVDTTAANTDMRGTDSAYTGTPPTVEQIQVGLATEDTLDEIKGEAWADETLVAIMAAAEAGGGGGGDATAENQTAILDTLAAIKGVGWSDETLVAVKAVLDAAAADVVNIDGDTMRGTDGAYTGTPPTVQQIATAVGAQAASAAALAAYDAATGADVTAAVSTLRGADNDTLETLSDQLDDVGTGDATAANQSTIIAALSTKPTAVQIDTRLSSTHGSGTWGGAAGSGARTIVFTVSDGEGTLANGISASIKDADDNTVAGPLATNSLGQVTFYLDDNEGAEVYEFVVPSTTTWTGGTAEVSVDGDASVSITLVPKTIAGPSDANYCRVFCYAKEPDGSIPSSGTLSLEKIHSPSVTGTGASQVTIVLGDSTRAIDDDGYAYIDILREAVVDLALYTNGRKIPLQKRNVTVTDAATANWETLS